MCVVIGYFVGDQPMRKIVAHTVVRSIKTVLGVGHLRLGFVHRGEGGLHRGGGGVYTSLWVTGRLICTTAFSF